MPAEIIAGMSRRSRRSARARPVTIGVSGLTCPPASITRLPFRASGPSDALDPDDADI